MSDYEVGEWYSIEPGSIPSIPPGVDRVLVVFKFQSPYGPQGDVAWAGPTSTLGACVTSISLDELTPITDEPDPLDGMLARILPDFESYHHTPSPDPDETPWDRVLAKHKKYLERFK